MPWTVPSSPGVPWSALNDHVGLQLGEAGRDVVVHVELETLVQPRSRSASATPFPLVSDTSRSADQPPISTTT